MTDYTYEVLYSPSGASWYRHYKTVVGKDRAIATARRLAKRKHIATKVISEARPGTVWESSMPRFERRKGR